MRQINADNLHAHKVRGEIGNLSGDFVPGFCIDREPTVDAVPVAVIKAYLQRLMDEWDALGDRKWEPANMWGYNFIRACQDDLEKVIAGEQS